MKRITLVTDKVIGESKIIPLNVPRERTAARGIVEREDGKIAILFKENMMEYKLPGGGMEEGETAGQTFIREVAEETGCEVTDLKPLGYTEERKSKTNFRQISYIYSAKVDKFGKLNLTDKEKAEGAHCLWMEPEEALHAMKNSLSKVKGSPIDVEESLYSTTFIVYRDIAILEYYIKHRKTK